MKKLVIIIRTTLIALLAILLNSVSFAACTKDTDCKNNRICEGGKCVNQEASQGEALHATYYNLTGTWNKGNDRINQYNDKLIVWIGQNRGPFNGYFTGINSISVNFVDVRGCCTAEITEGGKIIRWSNNTIWAKTRR